MGMNVKLAGAVAVVEKRRDMHITRCGYVFREGIEVWQCREHPPAAAYRSALSATSRSSCDSLMAAFTT
jgi:hypothetical protein